MIIIHHFIYKDKVVLEARIKYEKNFSKAKKVFHAFKSCNFTLNKTRRIWTKSYHAFDDVAKEIIERDLSMLKTLDNYYKLYSFKQISEENNYV